jgi:predicted ArsR family transcriptional regulator
MVPREDAEGRPAWTFLSNHAHVLVCLSRQPDIRLREVAAVVGITERAAQSIVADLVREGYVTRVREGRRNRYTVDEDRRLRHPASGGTTVGRLLAALEPESRSPAPATLARRLPVAPAAEVPTATATAGPPV